MVTKKQSYTYEQKTVVIDESKVWAGGLFLFSGVCCIIALLSIIITNDHSVNPITFVCLIIMGTFNTMNGVLRLDKGLENKKVRVYETVETKQKALVEKLKSGE